MAGYLLLHPKGGQNSCLEHPSPYESRQNEIMLQLNISMKLVSRNLFRRWHSLIDMSLGRDLTYLGKYNPRCLS
jgi:hypothetical protein